MPEPAKPSRIESVRGTQDVLPGDSAKWQEAEARVRRVLAAYGFREIRTPVFEHVELFRRSAGLGSDVVAKEMYEFTDRGDRKLALRPEGTPAVVRAYLEHGLYAKGSRHKLYYTGPVFRYDRPQAGRYRQHHQFGVEALGASDAAQDAEVIDLGRAVLESLDVAPQRYVIHLNSNGDAACRPAYASRLKAWLGERTASLCADCRGHRLEHNVLRVLDCKVPSCREATKDAPRIADALCEGCRAHHARLVQFLAALGIETEADHRLVRGLDYYTRTVFEFVMVGGGEAGTLLGGGRYDGLVELLGGPATPAVGWGMGIERVLAASPLETPPEDVQVYVVCEHAAAERRALTVATAVRALGYRCEVGQAGTSANSQMRAANKSGALAALFLRYESGEGLLKHLRHEAQVTVPNPEEVLDLASRLKQMGIEPSETPR